MFRRWRTPFIVLSCLLLVALLAWLVIREMTTPDAGRKKRVVQEISLLKPPPPPPPPKVEPPKLEPPKMELREKLQTPEPDQPTEKAANEPPPGPALGLDAAGGAGSDSFGLAARKGGADLIGGAGVGAGSGTIVGGGVPASTRFAWYGALVQESIQDAVSRDKTLGTADYRVQVHVWINGSGVVSRVELVGSTGDATLDGALQQALRNLRPLREGAPGDMPQPIKLRITARG